MQGSRGNHNITVRLEIASSIEGVDKLSQGRHSSVLELRIPLSLPTHFQECLLTGSFIVYIRFKANLVFGCIV